MIEVALQKKNKTLYPYSEEDLEALSEYKENQVIRAKLYGVEKPRSYEQLKLYWQLCKVVSENSDWPTKDAVDFNIRVALDFRDPSRVAVRPDGQVQFYYRSIAFVNLKHIAACQFFDRAFEVMAKKLGITVDELLENANTGQP
jgi:hypothetical protein